MAGKINIEKDGGIKGMGQDAPNLPGNLLLTRLKSIKPSSAILASSISIVPGWKAVIWLSHSRQP
jgi:hypothetical protein